MIEIYKPTEVTDELVQAFASLIPQLAPHLEIPSKAMLQEVVSSPQTNLFIAKYAGKIVGTLSLVIYKIPTGKKAWIEDVIIDSNARGLGIAYQLMQEAIKLAKLEQVEKLDLTSSHTREAAHKLYYKCGFEKRDTGIFRLLL